MKPVKLLRVATSCALALLMMIASAPLRAQTSGTGVTQDPKGGGVRSGNGQTLHASVTVDGTASKALVAVWSSTGALVASGTSTSLGTYVKQLTAGTYTVTATTAKGSASASVTIVAATSPAIVPLAITSTAASQ
jgi:uncharacterized protein YjdB